MGMGIGKENGNGKSIPFIHNVFGLYLFDIRRKRLCVCINIIIRLNKYELVRDVFKIVFEKMEK